MPIKYGINFHPFRVGNPSSNDAPTFKAMRLRNLQVARIDVPATADHDADLVPRLQSLAQQARDNGVYLLPIVQTAFTWGDRTDNGLYPAGDATALYNQGYNRMKALATTFRNDFRDWELGNELNLLMHDGAGSPLFGKGWNANEFSASALMNDWAQVLKGCSDAIDWVNTTYGVLLRRVLNTTGTMFGFIDFMATKGVKFEVIDYHSYERKGYVSTAQWANGVEGHGVFQTSFSLYAKLALYARPVILGEINAAEVYDVDYLNLGGDPKTETGYCTFRSLLKQAADQTSVTIESVIPYSLVDDPAYAGTPEAKFGMMSDLNTSKISMLLLAKRSGGYLSDAENAVLVSRNLQSL